MSVSDLCELKSLSRVTDQDEIFTLLLFSRRFRRIQSSRSASERSLVFQATVGKAGEAVFFLSTEPDEHYRTD